MNRTAVPSWWQKLINSWSPRPTHRTAKQRRRFELLQLQGRVVPSVSHGVIANDDFADTDGNNPVQVNVLENDQAVGTTIDPATLQIVTSPAHGTASITAGTITYAATGNFR